MVPVKIGRSQWDALSARAVARFEDRMVVHLRARPSAAAGSEDGVRRLVRNGIAAAAGYGVSDVVDVERYLELMADHGADFDAAAWAVGVLRDDGLDGSAKIDRLDACEARFLSAGAR